MIRFFRELRNPIEKCMRVGHKWRVQFRSGYTRPEIGFRTVLDEVEQERCACKRCGLPDPKSPEWKDVERRGLSGYSWPKSMADEFRKNGELWTETGWRSQARTEVEGTGPAKAEDGAQ